MPELSTLDFSEGWQSLIRGQTCQQFEHEVMPAYLAKQRWFASKGSEVKRTELKTHFVFPGPDANYFLATLRAHLSGDYSEDYFVPLAVEWREPSANPVPASTDVIALVRKADATGVLKDALAEPSFIADLVRAAGENKELANGDCKLRFSRTGAYISLREDDEKNIKKLGAEQSNSSILIAKKMILKAYRKLEPGVQPELEMGRYLTEVANFQNTPPLLGSIEQTDPNGEPTALAVIQGFVPNQGDGWSYTLNHLKQFFNGILEDSPDDAANRSYFALVEKLGNRIGELQQAFALENSDPAFQPEPISPADVAARKQEIQSEAETTFGLLASSEGMLPPEQQRRVRALLDQRRRILDLISAFKLDPGSPLMKTRFHGDLHLGQVLVAGNDFYIIDFEGEPARPFAQRRSKQSPLKDVAGMLRSLDYAAWSALFDCAAGDSDKMVRLEKPATEWAHASADALMRGYRKTAEGCPSYPADAQTFRQLLDIFVLEKALYEVRYELANRPSWLRIPVEGIMSLLETSQVS